MPIATHELGHSLGLGHSKDRESIMYAYYKSSMPASGLTDDDVKAIQYLYGKSEATLYVAIIFILNWSKICNLVQDFFCSISSSGDRFSFFPRHIL